MTDEISRRAALTDRAVNAQDWFMNVYHKWIPLANCLKLIEAIDTGRASPVLPAARPELIGEKITENIFRVDAEIIIELFRALRDFVDQQAKDLGRECHCQQCENAKQALDRLSYALELADSLEVDRSLTVQEANDLINGRLKQ